MNDFRKLDKLGRPRRNDGVRTLEDIRGRCRIDEETGCWIWAGAMAKSLSRQARPTSRVWLPEGLQGDGQNPTVTTAAKAAWLLSGRKLQDGQVVYRYRCADGDCCNPEHGKAGTRPEMHRFHAASDRLKGDPKRAAVNAINRRAVLKPVEVVRQAEAMFAAGVAQKEVMAELGLQQATARSIRLGTHPNCTHASRVLPMASVFAMGRACA